MAEHLPVYNIPKILATRERLLNEVFLPYYSLVCENEDFEDFVQQVSKALPGLPLETLRSTMQNVAGTELVNDPMEDLAWRLAGNMHHIRRGQAIPPWSRQLFDEWVPIQIMSIDKIRIKKKAGPGQANYDPEYLRRLEKRQQENKGALQTDAGIFNFLVLGGLPAGHTFSRLFAAKYCFHIRDVFGFAKWDVERFTDQELPKRFYPMRDILELTRLRFLGLITPEVCRNGLSFDQLACPPSCQVWNKQQMKRRRRQDYACPMGYSLETHPCFQCEVGYDQCKAGCHPTTYVKGQCPKCRREDAYLDPSKPDSYCVECERWRK